MQITLKKMKILNFKGIRELEADFSPGTTNISGTNGAGKTSIFDAFTWVMFGKDSHGAKDFELKPLDKDNNVIPRLETSVEAILEADGKERIFRRTSREKWTKKRGSAVEIFTGNETLYEVDNVPCKMSDYGSKVSELIDESLFKMLTNPGQFCSLKWQEQRKILMEIAKVPDDEEIAVANQMSAIAEILAGGKTVEDRAAELAANKKRISKELDSIPIRIDEIKRTLGSNSQRSLKEVERDICETKAHIQELEKEISTLTSSAGKIAVEAKISKIEAEKQNKIAEYNSRKVQQEAKKNAAELELRTQKEELQRKIENHKKTISECKRENAEAEKLVESLRKEYKATFDMKFTDTACPLCGREWDKEVVEEKKTEFMKNRAEKCKSLNKRGSDMKAGIETNNKIMADKTVEIKELENRLESMNMKGIDYSQFETAEPDCSEYDRQIAELRNSVNVPSTLRQEKDIELLQTQLDTLEQEKAEINAGKKQEERIKQLEAEHKAQAQAVADIEKEEAELKAFRDAKIAILDKQINNRFELVKFKLYDQQINGGYTECCEATINGVPYNSSLNDGAKINAGLDIINTLQENYGIYAPVFIDNKESIVEPIKLKSQTIYLTVTNDSKLSIN